MAGQRRATIGKATASRIIGGARLRLELILQNVARDMIHQHPAAGEADGKRAFRQTVARRECGRIEAGVVKTIRESA
ncbi:hypothetical protein D3C75_1052730 [compost metagenome]